MFYGSYIGFGAGTVTAAAPAAYAADAATFDGTSTYVQRTSALSGLSGGKRGIISGWSNFNGGDGVVTQILEMVTTGFISFPFRSAANKYQFTLQNNDLTTPLSITSNSSWVVASGWHNFLCSWDVGIGATHLYIDDSDDEAGGSTATNVTLDYSKTTQTVGAVSGGSAKLDGDLFDFYVNLDEYLDLDVTANRRKFIDAAGKPVFLGADGSEPTGNQPLMFHHIDSGAAASTFGDNLGTGGAFSITGSLTIAATSPTD